MTYTNRRAAIHVRGETMQNQSQSNTTDALESLLRGEMSAVETYEKALTQVEGYAGGPQLRQLHADHTEAVGLLRDMLIRYQGETPTSSGPWGAFANTVQATANLFGDAAALKSLKEGEEHGIRSYEAALADADVAEDVKGMVRALLSRCQAHVPVLDALIDRA